MVRFGWGGWIGLIGGAVGALVGFIAVFLTSPVIGGGLYLLFLLVFGGIFWAILGPIFRRNALLKNGEPAQARILEMWDTGVTLNNSPQVGLKLSVNRPGHPAYEAKTKTFVSRLQPGLFQPGMTVAVRVDPKKPENVAIEGIARAG